MAAVLVTGGAKRIGAEIVRRFAREGWAVLIHANASVNEAGALARELTAAGGKASVVTFDLGKPETFAAAMAQGLALAPDLSVLVNSASHFEFDRPEAPDPELWTKVMAVNALGPACLTAEFLKQVRAEKRRIVNLLDQKLANLNPDFFSYTASKAALAAISQMMASAFRDSAKIVTVAPGLTLPSDDQTDAEFEKAATANLLKRRTRASEVADAVWFAATGPIASGETLFVDSGQRFVPLDRDIMFHSRQGS
jgi:NAD(P)-dependent dehydrogenase (short-subunit alcohol dehydrogenase family)